MFQDTITLKRRHQRFIETVCKSELVYVLKNKKGFANSRSVNYESEEGEPITIICFWAEKSLAKSCIADTWSNYSVEEISLNDFIENWCIGMENDGLLVGTEFDKNMFGYEAEPLELILDLIEKLKSLNKNISLKKFKNLSDLEKQILTVLN